MRIITWMLLFLLVMASLSVEVKAYVVRSSGEKAKDPIFGLTMGSSSQGSDDVFRWFCVESGSTDNPSVMLIHGFPSQAYSYRKVLPILSKDYHVIAFDWLGFGFSDKPQPKYGFDYTMEEYTASLKTLIDDLVPNKVSLVVQGYFSPVVVKYAFDHQDKVNDVILINPPDPLRASDKALTSSGPYKMKEDDAMVYRSPYLTSGSSGFALNAVSRSMKKQLKDYVQESRKILMNENWKVRTTVCWGQRDRWLNYDGVEDFCKESNHKLVELPMAGHHVQEDSGEELGNIVAGLLSKQRRI
uniref:AB hydrolase-1 domain-containing protein n=1 Tax=Chenopodium quinoa TaxID=63459 RepID=A0A803MFR1_CHEQI